MQIQLPDKKCVICNEAINNPICMDCINKELKQWIDENKWLGKKEIGLNLLEQGNNHYIEKCLLCKKPIIICAHCYYHEMSGTIKEKFPELEEEFKVFFGLFGE